MKEARTGMANMVVLRETGKSGIREEEKCNQCILKPHGRLE